MGDEHESVEWRESGPVLCDVSVVGRTFYTREHLAARRDMAQREADTWARRLAVLDAAIAAKGEG